MTAYAPTDVRATSAVAGGCGEGHLVEPVAGGGRGVTCALCEPGLLKLWGWAGSPEGVKLTPDEVAVLEDSKAQGLAAQALAAKAIGERLAATVLSDAIAPASSVAASPESVSKTDLAKLIAQLDPAERDELLKGVGVKRGPGRPPKTA
jgi:hypothetical protein